MTKNSERLIKLLVIGYLLVLLVPLAVHAQEVKLFPGGYWGPVVPERCATGGCQSICDIFDTAQRVIYILMSLTLFAFGPIWIVIGGFLILVSGGSSERVTNGRKMIMGAVIGILIALGAFVIINTFFYFIAQGGQISIDSYWPTVKCATAPGYDPGNANVLN
jgi:Type IV secretion system pilin